MLVSLPLQDAYSHFSSIICVASVPFLKWPVENYAWFSSIMALLAPLLLVVFISLLPKILLAFVKLEGHIEIKTMQHPSLFSKLAAFTILQTFFILTIASTLFSSLQDILNNISKAFSIIVQNLLALGIELLHISPIVTNILRKVLAEKLGHNLTEKDRGEVFLGLVRQHVFFSQFRYTLFFIGIAS